MTFVWKPDKSYLFDMFDALYKSDYFIDYESIPVKIVRNACFYSEKFLNNNTIIKFLDIVYNNKEDLPEMKQILNKFYEAALKQYDDYALNDIKKNAPEATKLKIKGYKSNRDYLNSRFEKALDILERPLYYKQLVQKSMNGDCEAFAEEQR